MKKKFYICFVSALLSVALVSGCAKNDKNVDTESESKVVTEIETETETQTETEAATETEAETEVTTEAVTETEIATETEITTEITTEVTVEAKDLTVTVYNFTGVDLGGFSYIAPLTGEQVNTGKFENEHSYTIELVWPLDETEFKWALYTAEGKLAIEGSSDFSAAENTATIIINGDGKNVTDVSVDF